MFFDVLWSFKGECYKYWILNDHNDTLITRSLIIYADYNVIHYVHQLMYHLCKSFWPSHYKPINRPNQHEMNIISISSEFFLCLFLISLQFFLFTTIFLFYNIYFFLIQKIIIKNPKSQIFWPFLFNKNFKRFNNKP